MKERLKTLWSVAWYNLRHFRTLERRLLVINVVGLLASLLAPQFEALAARWVEISYLDLSIFILTMMLNVLLLTIDFFRSSRPRIGGLHLERVFFLDGIGDNARLDLHMIEPSSKAKRNGFCRIQLPERTSKPKHEAVIVNSKVDEQLAQNKMIQVELRKRYEQGIMKQRSNYWDEMQDYLSLMAEKHKNRRLFNETKIALASPLDPTTELVYLGKTTYFTSLVTNEACTHLIKSERFIFRDLRHLFPLSTEDTLLSLEESRLSNHIGISVLIHTQDRRVVLWRQAESVMQNRGQLVASGSGSLDWSDGERSQWTDLLSIVKYGMAREFCEESQLEKSEKPLTIQELTKKILVIGYFRWIKRGGKPEFIGIGEIPRPLSDLRPNWEAESLSGKGRSLEAPLVETTADIIAMCDRYLDSSWLRKHGYEVSTPLAALLHRLRSILKGDLGEEARRNVLKCWGIDG